MQYLVSCCPTLVLCTEVFCCDDSVVTDASDIPDGYECMTLHFAVTLRWPRTEVMRHCCCVVADSETCVYHHRVVLRHEWSERHCDKENSGSFFLFVHLIIHGSLDFLCLLVKYVKSHLSCCSFCDH